MTGGCARAGPGATGQSAEAQQGRGRSALVLGDEAFEPGWGGLAANRVHRRLVGKTGGSQDLQMPSGEAGGSDPPHKGRLRVFCRRVAPPSPPASPPLPEAAFPPVSQACSDPGAPTLPAALPWPGLSTPASPPSEDCLVLDTLLVSRCPHSRPQAKDQSAR